MRIRIRKLSDIILVAILIIMCLMSIIFTVRENKILYDENIKYKTEVEILNNRNLRLQIENQTLSNKLFCIETYYNSQLNSLLNNSFDINSDEFSLLCKVVHCEAAGEPYEGQVAVARVVLNRYLSNKWNDNSISEVIYHPGQFTTTVNRLDSVSPNIQNCLAVVDALNNTIEMPLEVDSFETIYSGTQENSRYQRWKTIGNHNFNILN